MATDSATAVRGRVVKARAAAGGPIIRLKMSAVPTTGTVMVVASATSIRNASSAGYGGIPRACAESGRVEDSSSGRYRTVRTTRQTAASTMVGPSWLVLIPSTSPN